MLAVRIGTPLLLAVGGLLCALLALAGLLVLAITAFRRLARRGKPDPVARAQMLQGLDYEPVAEGRWIRAIPGLPLTFEDSGGWRWTARLPRYGTLHLAIEERQGKGLGALSSDNTFLTQDAELDERFIVRSDRPSQTLDLLADQQVGDLLLAMPFVDLELRGDEIVVSDPQRRGLAKLCGGPVEVATPRALKAEAKLHEHVVRLCKAFVAALPRQA